MTTVQKNIIKTAKENLDILEEIKSSNIIIVAKDGVNQFYITKLDETELMSDDDKEFLELVDFKELKIIKTENVTDINICTYTLKFNLFTFAGILNVEICNRNDIKINFIEK